MQSTTINSDGIEQKVRGFQIERVKEACRTSLDWFGGFCLPDDCTLKFPNFYVALFMQVVSALRGVRDFSKFAIGFPRGHGKTMWLKLLIVYTILFTKKRFILVVGATEGHAKNIIADVCDMLASSNVRKVFGSYDEDMDVDRQELKKFYFCGRPIILLAAGTGSAIRGVNIKNSRPDLIIFDDSQTKDCAASLVEAQKYINWFYGTALKAKNPKGCTFLYVGNMYPDMELKPGIYTCQLRNLQFSAHWKSLIVGAILEDGSALWEELQPLAQLLVEYQQDCEAGEADTFAAEVLNDPRRRPNTGLDTGKIGLKRKLPGELHQGNFIIIDPANDKKVKKRGAKKSDDTAIGYFEKYDGRRCCMKIYSEIMSPLQTIYRALELAIEHNCQWIFVEAQAYQYSLLFWFNHIAQQQNLEGINFLPVYTGHMSKNSRILNMFKSLMAHELLLSPEVHALAVPEALEFDASKDDNTDNMLDVLAHSEKVDAEYGQDFSIEGTASLVVENNLDSLPVMDTEVTYLF